MAEESKQGVPTVLTVPMRNGNSISFVTVPSGFVGVLTVPMRNGNRCMTCHCPHHRRLRSYRTYEEWKPPSIAELRDKAWVLTVPMRNGNRKQYRTSFRCTISSYRTYEEWKPTMSGLESFQNLAFLPYLWGMETQSFKFVPFSSVSSSYRTYEEWKPTYVPTGKRVVFRSYRTYEEWKQ